MASGEAASEDLNLVPSPPPEEPPSNGLEVPTEVAEVAAPATKSAKRNRSRAKTPAKVDPVDPTVAEGEAAPIAKTPAQNATPGDRPASATGGTEPDGLPSTGDEPPEKKPESPPKRSRSRKTTPSSTAGTPPT
ncbi:MAG: hypothetical protein HC918_07240 [Oscillatoriales cyanobacterium SM2_1_8]|nr:hypothetical protein [Oscillatoriales cyanobacterium SM2_1_8]